MICIPLIIFQEKVLKTLNLALSQFHANNWAFVRALEIVYRGLDITCIIGIFFL